MKTPENLKYTETHEWVGSAADGTLAVGISDHAQEVLGDIVFLELPPVGKRFAQGEACAVIESVKAAADLYAPVSGEVVGVNATLVDAPQSINQDAYVAWLFRLKPDNPAEFGSLLDARAYAEQATSAE